MVSVIIPTYNAAAYLPSLLTRLSEQTQPHELIIIDSESDDETRAILKSYNIAVHAIPKVSFNHGVTRNLGISLAKHDILVYLTQDALPAHKDSLEQLVNMLVSQENIGMVYGRQLPYPQAKLLSRFARLTNYPAKSLLKSKALIPELGIKACHCSNSFAAYRKDRLLSVGGFPTDTILGEDVTVAARMILSGQILGYCAEAEVYHSHDYTIMEELRRYFDIGVFHKQQQATLAEFSNAESQGLSYVLDEWKYLIEKSKFSLIPEQLLRTFAKYVGYKAGIWHKSIPISLKRKYSMHSAFWEELN